MVQGWRLVRANRRDPLRTRGSDPLNLVYSLVELLSRIIIRLICPAFFLGGGGKWVSTIFYFFRPNPETKGDGGYREGIGNTMA